MKRMNSIIYIGAFEFKNRVSAVQIETSMDSITQKAVITLPNMQGLLEDKINEGDEVFIHLGYDGVYNEEFRGYVNFIKPKVPLEIHCEDAMYNFKRQSVAPKSWRQTTLQEVLTYIAPDAIINVWDVTLSGFKIENVASRAEALEQLKSEYGFVAYFRLGQLYCGIPYTDNQGDVNYKLRVNCMADDLEFKKSTAVRLKLRLISMQPDNSKIEVIVGDADGEERTVHYYNLTKSALQALADDEIKRMKYDGYYGKINAKGVPFVVHGMAATVLDDKYPQRKGKYAVEAVTTTYNGDDGFSRELTIGPKL